MESVAEIGDIVIQQNGPITENPDLWLSNHYAFQEHIN